MTIYSCPMHPQIQEEKEGQCPICGMKLVNKAHLKAHNKKEENLHVTYKSYIPLLIVVGLIFATTLTLTVKDLKAGTFMLEKSISYFMIGFFLSFSAFKLMDLKGFAQGYSTYDVLAQRWFGYGYAYPFLELFFGLSMILLPHSITLLFAEFIVMTFSGIGVGLKIAKREQFQCACLGTFLKVPLTKITLIEDFGMAVLAVFLLLLK